jgi:hypothetical protein
MTLFQTHGFQKVKGFISPFFSLYLRNYFTLRTQNDFGVKNPLCRHPTISAVEHGDDQAPNSHCVYGDPAFDMVMAMSAPDLGKIVEKKLISQYTYARIYKHGSVLLKHDDRPECQYSVTLSLGGEYEKPWPIWIKDYDGKSHEVSLDEGDMLIYAGHDLEHWREKFEGNTQYQLFMHYVDGDGEFKDLLYDDRPNIGLKK